MELGTALDQAVPVDEVEAPVRDVATFSMRGAWRILQL